MTAITDAFPASVLCAICDGTGIERRVVPIPTIPYHGRRVRRTQAYLVVPQPCTECRGLGTVLIVFDDPSSP